MKTNENNTTTAIAAQSTKSTVLLSIDKIRPNPNNPRRSYDENALAELAASIATHGLIHSPSGCEPQNRTATSLSAANAATAPCNYSARPRSRPSSIPPPRTNGRSSTSRFRRTFSARKCRRSTRPKPTKPPCRPSEEMPPPWPHASARASSISTTG